MKSQDELLQDLASYQGLLLQQLQKLDINDYKQQYHADLSPAGWHIGHCVYTEFYWVREAWLGTECCSNDLKGLYIPELSSKESRGGKLPAFDDLIAWAKEVQKTDLDLIRSSTEENKQHELMQNNFLLYFLIQHYAQHYETIQMVVHARNINKEHHYFVQRILESEALIKNLIPIPGKDYPIGTDSKTLFYDNEVPPHQISLDTFQINQQAVSNAEYLRFMERGGYEDNSLWSVDDWQWLNDNQIKHPFHWRQDDHGHWYGINDEGPHDLIANDKVYGLSHYEATAFAKWAGMRLPHEYEWETANKVSAFDDNGQSWEWCANYFHPYPDFKPFPYEGYSVPYFDEKHFTLKGGSQQTRNIIKRPSFRNYYEADKRHIFAGIRLAKNE